jgi:hypothetical protein
MYKKRANYRKRRKSKYRVQNPQIPSSQVELDTINFEGVDQPVRISKRLRLLSNIGVAAGVD